MNVAGARAAASFGAEPDIAAWAGTVALNPARIPPEHSGSGAVDAALSRMRTHLPAGLARLAELAASP
jgi:hypothetical protein